jgi:hypothetical protein
MAQIKVAHLREQGQDMIIIPMDSQFGQKTSAQQNQTIAALQQCASSAGLAGTVVVVWRTGNRHNFIAPPQWQSFFRTLPWNTIIANLNKVLTCN